MKHTEHGRVVAFNDQVRTSDILSIYWNILQWVGGGQCGNFDCNLWKTLLLTEC